MAKCCHWLQRKQIKCLCSFGFQFLFHRSVAHVVPKVAPIALHPVHPLTTWWFRQRQIQHTTLCAIVCCTASDVLLRRNWPLQLAASSASFSTSSWTRSPTAVSLVQCVGLPDVAVVVGCSGTVFTCDFCASSVVFSTDVNTHLCVVARLFSNCAFNDLPVPLGRPRLTIRAGMVTRCSCERSTGVMPLTWLSVAGTDDTDDWTWMSTVSAGACPDGNKTARSSDTTGESGAMSGSIAATDCDCVFALS